MASVTRIAGVGGVKHYLGFLLHHWVLTLVTFAVVATFAGGLFVQLYQATIGRLVNMVRGGGTSAAA